MPRAGGMPSTWCALSLVPTLCYLGQRASHLIVRRHTVCIYMYIVHVRRVAMRTLKLLCAHRTRLHFHSLTHHTVYTMPIKSRKSRAAKQRRYRGQSGFVKQANAPSPDSSVYCLSDDNTDASATATDTSSGRERNNQAAVSRDSLQRLYSVFLPPHLQLNEDSRVKRQKTSKRSAVYTKDSRTTAWRRNVAGRKAAEGCTTLDAFIQRKVRCRSNPIQSILSLSLAAAQPLTNYLRGWLN